jgi:hypothetical protein
MKFAETEGTGISHRAESEGTGITRLAESEGTGIGKQKSMKWLLAALFLTSLTQVSLAAELHLYSSDQVYVKGLYSEGSQAAFVEGLLDGATLELIGKSSLLDDIKASDEGTGGRDASDEGTGGRDASDEGTGSTEASDEGTGGNTTEASDEGTGGYLIEDNGTTTVNSLILTLDCASQTAYGSATDGQETIDLKSVHVFLNGKSLTCEDLE